MFKLRENLFILIITASISAFTSTAASAFQLGSFKEENKQTKEKVLVLESKVGKIEEMMIESRMDRMDMRKDILFIKEILTDIKTSLRGRNANHN